MADPAATLALLGNDELKYFRDTIAGGNIYSQLAPAVGGVKWDRTGMSVGEQFGTSLAQSFLAAALGKIGQNQVASQVSQATSLLPDLYKNPSAVVIPEGMDSEAGNMLKLMSMAKEQQRAAIKQNIADELFNAGETERIKALNKIKGENEAYGTTGAENPDSPQFKLNERTKKEEDEARAEIAKLPAPAKLLTTQAALAAIKPYKDLDTASSDIPFATLFIQGLDGSVVREGEYMRVAGTNPFLDKFRTQLEATLNGTSGLGVATKQRIYNEMASAQPGLLDAAMQQAAKRLYTATSRGADARNTLPFDPEMKFDLAPTPSITPEDALAELQRRGIIPK